MGNHVVFTAGCELTTALQPGIGVDHNDGGFGNLDAVARAPSIGSIDVRQIGFVKADARDLHAAHLSNECRGDKADKTLISGLVGGNRVAELGQIWRDAEAGCARGLNTAVTNGSVEAGDLGVHHGARIKRAS